MHTFLNTISLTEPSPFSFPLSSLESTRVNLGQTLSPLSIAVERYGKCSGGQVVSRSMRVGWIHRSETWPPQFFVTSIRMACSLI